MKRAGHVDMPPELNAVKVYGCPVARDSLLACSAAVPTSSATMRKGLCKLSSLVQAEIKPLRTCGYKEKDFDPDRSLQAGVSTR